MDDLSKPITRRNSIIGMAVANPNTAGGHHWRGASRKAAEMGKNFLCVVAGPLDSPYPNEAASNALLSLLEHEDISNVLVSSSTLQTFSGQAGLKKFISRLAKPSIGIESAIEGFPSVTIDNYGGMSSVVRHLIVDHGKHRIAFMRGPLGHEGAAQRYQAWLDCMETADLPVDGLLGPPPAHWSDNEIQRVFVQSLLDRKACDAIVAVNDHFALIAMQVLESRGIKVPQDIAVTGFDNQNESAYSDPPLTTAWPNFSILGELAFNMAAEPEKYRDIPPIRPELIIRMSCGCDYWPEQFARDAKKYRETVHGSISADSAALAAMIKTGEIATTKGKRKFIVEFDRQISNTLKNIGTEEQALGMVVEIRESLGPEIDPSMHNFLDSLFIRASERIIRIQACLASRLEGHMNVLISLYKALGFAENEKNLVRSLERYLPMFGIKTAFLVLFDVTLGIPNRESRSRLVMAMTEEKNQFLLPLTFQPMKEGFLPLEVREYCGTFNLIAYPLVLREELHGTLIFGAECENMQVYGQIANQVGSALYGIRTHELFTKTINQINSRPQPPVASTGTPIPDDIRNVKSY